MTTDSVKGLIELASAVTGLSVDKARDVTRSVLTAALEAVDNPSAVVTHLSDVMRSAPTTAAASVSESVSAAATGLTDTIREEIDKAAARLGFVREEELAALRARVQRLEAQVAQAASPASSTSRQSASKTGARAGAAAAKKSAPTRRKSA